MRRIRRALISVSDKTGIVDFARELKRLGVEIISTGGTAAVLRQAGIEVRDVSELTGFPEMMDGRVKTLHPKIHGGLLAIRENPTHQSAMRDHSIEPIDMVVVNLYPFEETIKRSGVTLAQAIEQIDIGGPAMIRSAAKNAQDVTVLVLPADYIWVIDEMKKNDGSLSRATRRSLAREAFGQTSRYDMIVFAYLTGAFEGGELPTKGMGVRVGGSGSSPFFITDAAGAIKDETAGAMEEFKSAPKVATFTLKKSANLRYGENPHQSAALYDTGARAGIALAEVLSGKEMSFNNYVDADAAWQLVSDFNEIACAIVKHTNPAGVAVGTSAEVAYRRALATDPVSAFGGIVAFNRKVDETAARALIEIFTEVIVAPDYDEQALDVLRTKKNLRVLRTRAPENAEGLEYKQITGGMLVQTRDTHKLKPQDLKVVTAREPTDDEVRDLVFAWTVCKHTKSNAIVYAHREQTVGVGAGQMSRVDSVKIGAMRAQLPIKGSVLASDAFFPFRDGIDEAAKHGITAVIQPGGSVRDSEVIAVADGYGFAMVFTGIRHFKH
ncbi:MAG: bifunctional phosphoribosylaminoimidazolecarboxamide formyltransferase/IMP cyclohydrolase [Acidobacteriota bacterium]|nr:bifunctional phosphoribosylaminoimidazolecarboxamide formyltransferase/IMP cyclohydrolase [Acidobacteriota bacterium]